MAVVFSETFDTGPNGATLDIANTGYDNVILNAGSTAVFDNTVFASGGQSAKIEITTSAAILQKDFLLTSLRALRHYWRFPILPSSRASIVDISLVGTGVVAQLRLGADGLFAIRDGFTTVDTAVISVVPGEFVCTEWKLDGVAGQQDAKLYYGGNIFGSTPDETLTGPLTGASFDRINEGIPSAPSTAWSLFLDEVVHDDADFPGTLPPSAQPILAGSGSIIDQIMAGLISQGYLTGSVADREYERLQDKTAHNDNDLTILDLYELADEAPRIAGL